MDAILNQRAKIVMAKIEIAMGVLSGARPNVEQAQRILDEFARDIADDSDETPLELLGLPSIIITYLHAGGVNSVEQLCEQTDDDLHRMERVCADRIRKIDAALKRSGFSRVKG